jgi:hypothetical protein
VILGKPLSSTREMQRRCSAESPRGDLPSLEILDDGPGGWRAEPSSPWALNGSTAGASDGCGKRRPRRIGGVEVARGAICAQADPPGRKDSNGKRTLWWCRGKKNDPANACVNTRRVGRSAYFGPDRLGRGCFKRRLPETVSPKCLGRWCCGRPARVAALHTVSGRRKRGGSGLSPSEHQRIALRNGRRPARRVPASRAAGPYPEPLGQHPLRR